MHKDNKILYGFSALALIGAAAGALGYIPGTVFWDTRIVKDRVAQLMIDPASAQFRDVHTSRFSGNGSTSLCGEVNAKNRMGAYAGFNRFFWQPNSDEVYILDGTITKADVQDEINLCRYSGDCSRATEKSIARAEQGYNEELYAITCLVKKGELYR